MISSYVIITFNFFSNLQLKSSDRFASVDITVSRLCCYGRQYSLFVCLLGLFLDEVVQDVDGHGEDDGGVVLSRDGAQSLEVPQLRNRENKMLTMFLKCLR